MALEKIRPRVVDATGDYTFNNVTATGNLLTLNANLGNVAVANYVRTDHLQYANGVAWDFGGGGPGATVAGSNTQVQFNDASSFGASANFTFNKTSNTLTVTNITANGAGLTNLAGANVTGTVGNANYSAYAGNITVAAQPNITSVGTLTSLDVTGNISSGNANLGNLVIANYFSGSGNNLSNIQGSNVTGQVSYAATANSVAGANVTGAVTYAATANAVAGANVMGAVSYATTANSVAGANVSGAVSYATTANSVAGANVSGSVSSATTAGTVTTAAQPNITSVGTLTDLTVTGNSSAGNIKTDNLLYSNGTAWTFSGTYSNSNVASYLPTYTGNLKAGNATLGNLVVANYFSGADLTIAQIPATYSVSLTGTAYANVTSGSAMLGSGDYTIEFWIKTTDGDNGLFVSEPAGVSNGVGIFVSGNQLYFQKRYAAQALFDYDFTSMLDNAWHHVAFVRQSGTVKLYYDGVFKTSAADSTNYSSVTAAYRIGYSQQTFNYLTGYLSNFRVVNGVAVYTGNFTVPTSKLSTTQSSGSNIAAITTETVLLTFQDSTLIDNSSSARTVTGVNSPTISSSVIPFSGGAGTGNITASNANLGNLVVANYFSGSGNNLSNIQGSNVTGAVSYATTANAVAGANVSGQVGNALVAGTVYTAAQPNITSVGTLSSLAVTGDISGANLTLSGNLIVSGTTTSVNSTVTRVVDPIFELGGGANGAALTTDDNKDRGLLLHYYSGASTVDAFMGWDDSNGEFAFGSNVSITSEVTTFNSYGNVRANVYFGNGSQLTGVGAVSAGYISNGTSNVNIPTVNGNVTVGVAGTTNVVTVTGTGVNIAGYANLGSGNLLTTGNVSAGYIIGNGSQLTGIGGAAYIFNGNSNVNIPAANGNITANVGGTANIVVITSTGINVAGYANLGSGNLLTTGNVSAGYIIGNGSQLTGIGGAAYIFNGNSNVNIPSANGNITANVGGVANVIVISTTGLNVAGKITSTGNIDAGSNYFLGNGYYLSGVDAAGQIANGTSNIRIPTANANITFTVNGTTAANITSTGFVLLGTGNITAGNVYANAGTIGASALTGTLSTANQYNVTNVGTLGNLTVTTNIVSGNVYANSGIIKGQYLYGDGSNLTGLGGAGYIFNGTSNVFIPTSGGNVNFTVGGYTGIMTVTTTGANIGGYANVTGNLSVVGNISGGNANLGNAVVANYFTGNFYGPANTAGTVTTAAQPNITSVGTLTSLDVTGTANLGTASNVKIGGGAANYFLKTDGSGNLSWAVPAGGGGGGGTSLTYTAGTNPPATGNVLGDQWFNTSGNILYEYISDGTASYWVDISSPSFSTNAANYSIAIQDEGVNLTPTVTSINFTGSGISATNSGNAVTVTVNSTPLLIQDEGVNLTSTANTINFVGSTVSATNVGNVVTVTVSGTSNTSIRAQAMTMGILFGG